MKFIISVCKWLYLAPHISLPQLCWWSGDGRATRGGERGLAFCKVWKGASGAFAGVVLQAASKPPPRASLPHRGSSSLLVTHVLPVSQGGGWPRHLSASRVSSESTSWRLTTSRISLWPVHAAINQTQQYFFGCWRQQRMLVFSAGRS